MNHQDYLSELLSIQCEHAYGTVQRLKDTGALSDEDRAFLVKAQDVLISLRDRFRVTKTDGSKGAVTEVFERMATTLDHAHEHYKTEAK